MWSEDQYRSCVSLWLVTVLGTLRLSWLQIMIKAIVEKGKARFAFVLDFVIKVN